MSLYHPWIAKELFGENKKGHQKNKKLCVEKYKIKILIISKKKERNVGIL